MKIILGKEEGTVYISMLGSFTYVLIMDFMAGDYVLQQDNCSNHKSETKSKIVAFTKLNQNATEIVIFFLLLKQL